MKCRHIPALTILTISLNGSYQVKLKVMIGHFQSYPALVPHGCIHRNLTMFMTLSDRVIRMNG